MSYAFNKLMEDLTKQYEEWLKLSTERRKQLRERLFAELDREIQAIEEIIK